MVHLLRFHNVKNKVVFSEGLVHKSQMSCARVEDPSEMLAKGERVYCKVISITDEGEKISLSMKVVNQTTGQDLDPNNVQSSQDEKKRRQWNFKGKNKIELGAELNTTCRRCGGHGHLTMDCFVGKGDNQYDLVPEMDKLMEMMGADEQPTTPKKKKKKEKKKSKRRRHSSSSSSDSDDESVEERSLKRNRDKKRSRESKKKRHSSREMHSESVKQSKGYREKRDEETDSSDESRENVNDFENKQRHKADRKAELYKDESKHFEKHKLSNEKHHRRSSSDERDHERVNRRETNINRRETNKNRAHLESFKSHRDHRRHPSISDENSDAERHRHKHIKERKGAEKDTRHTRRSHSPSYDYSRRSSRNSSSDDTVNVKEEKKREGKKVFHAEERSKKRRRSSSPDERHRKHGRRKDYQERSYDDG